MESQKKLEISWEPLSGTISQQTRPRLQITRPLEKKKMSIRSFDKSDTMFGSLNRPANRVSLFNSEVNTDSTAAESMFSNSISYVDRNVSIVDLGRRTSLFLN